MNEAAERQRAALLDHLQARRDEHVEEFYLLVTEDQCLDLAAGIPPLAVQAMARALLDWTDAARRNAAKPIRTTRRKGKA